MRAKAAKTHQDELEHLANLPDEEIDTADIPETSPEQWRYARRPGRGEARVQPVAIEARTVTWFRARHGDAFEEAINEVLREHIRKAELAKSKTT
jgi:uncharacterized protein (DUF4415 family)